MCACEHDAQGVLTSNFLCLPHGHSNNLLNFFSRAKGEIFLALNGICRKLSCARSAEAHVDLITLHSWRVSWAIEVRRIIHGQNNEADASFLASCQAGWRFSWDSRKTSSFYRYSKRFQSFANPVLEDAVWKKVLTCLAA